MKLNNKSDTQQRTFEALPEKLLLKGGRLIDRSLDLDETADILIGDGVIESVGKIDTTGFDGEIKDISGMVVSPGWIDMHVHLREPGREDKETIETGSFAAANGGFTAVCCMPNTTPAIDKQEIIQYIKDRARESLVNVHPIAAITKNREGKELSEILHLVQQGAVAISDDGDPVMSAEIMRRALEYSKMVGIPVIGHEEDVTMTVDCHINEGYISTLLGVRGIPSVAEDIMIARDIMLTEYSGGHFHVAHIATAKSVELVREAKKKGISVTAEATPHHFTLTDEAVRTFDTNTKMKPPLRTQEDIDAIIEGLKDGTIDVIATDHAPHSWEEKASEFIFAPFGILGLETAIGLSMKQLVQTTVLGLKELVEKFTVNPYKIIGLDCPVVEKGKSANLTIFDPEADWKYDSANSLSKSSNTPFNGWEFKGKPHMVINNNKSFTSIL